MSNPYRLSAIAKILVGLWAGFTMIAVLLGGGLVFDAVVLGLVVLPLSAAVAIAGSVASRNTRRPRRVV